MNAEDQEVADRAKFLRELLAEFGMTLKGFNPGVDGGNNV